MSVAITILLIAAFINFGGLVASHIVNNLRMATIFTALILVNATTSIILALL